MNMKIPFNKPHVSGHEISYITDALNTNKLSGNGKYTQLCQEFFQTTYGFKKCLLTSSCTDALEMCAILAGIEPGDEVIMPSYTFVSTANAFVLRGATIRFADSRADHPGIDEDSIATLINSKTKAIVVVHYAGVACDMGKIMSVANEHGLLVIEDAAQAIDSYFIDSKGESKALGSIGHLAAFSFHETKNLISGEGGMLVVNDEKFLKRAEIVWEKGTNRSAFFRGEVDKYGWVDLGSSFLPSEITAAFLWGQLQNLSGIQHKRIAIWTKFNELLRGWAIGNQVQMPVVPKFSSNNAHMYYLVFHSVESRTNFISHMRDADIYPVFHYLSLHKSEFYVNSGNYVYSDCPHSDRYSDTLVRLPLYCDMTDEEQSKVIERCLQFV
jgi:dTDP-4-amino-4,6-dideoxygalactose transaminase